MAGAQAQSPEEWIKLGETVHGGFGTLIPLGIRIGLDARQRLKAAPRELDVTYYDGNGTPCACVVEPSFRTRTVGDQAWRSVFSSVGYTRPRVVKIRR